MEDAFQSLVEPCHISSSQEDLLRNRPFTRQSDDGTGDDSQSSGEVRVESAGIIMVSLPESTNDETATHDEFQTPPEEVHPTSSAEERTPAVDREIEVRVDDDKEDRVAADLNGTVGAATVELGKDSDLDIGFSKPTSAVKVVAVSYDGVGTREVSESEVEKFRVLPIDSQETSGEPPSKKPKIYEENLATGSPKGSLEIVPVKSTKSPQILNVNSLCSGDCNTVSPQNNQGNGTMLVEDSLTKKKLSFPESEDTRGVSGLGENPRKTASDVELNKGEDAEDGKSNGYVSESEVDELPKMVGRDTVRKNIEDLEKFKYIVLSARNGTALPPLSSEVTQGRRELPLSIRGPVEDAAADSVIGNRQQVTVLDVLKILCGECDWIPEETEETDILEIAKRRGMTFPRPRWWSPTNGEEV